MTTAKPMAMAIPAPASLLSRSLNERLILSHIRRRQELPKADLARLTGLSSTAVGAIIRQLDTDGLVRRGEPQKGRVGQPSVPYSIDPDGACSAGLKIGRRSAEFVLLDATMSVIASEETTYRFPEPEPVLDFAERAAKRMLAAPERRERLAGLGVAMPSEIWCWSDEMGAPPGALAPWRALPIAETFGARLGVQAVLLNDAAAACAAQLARDPGLDSAPASDFVYFFVGWFIGGGIALDGRVHEGRRGNSGALGSMPVTAPDGATTQLIRTASLFSLERDLCADGVDPQAIWGESRDWSGFGPALDRWIDRAASGVAQAIAAAASVIDFDAAVIDGSFPADVRRRFVEQVRSRFERLDRQGLSPVGIREGGVGRSARATGAACQPLLAAFAVDDAALRKSGPATDLAEA
jgi:predicted NBD/HSP70 family sugar kinase